VGEGSVVRTEAATSAVADIAAAAAAATTATVKQWLCRWC